MKKLIFTLLFALSGFGGIAQTAVNFTCNDCAGNPHDLFTELDAGKVVVISWVMPCASCIGPTLTASNIVQSYSGSNPGQVVLYVVDDYANTNCTATNGWCTSNGITPTATFSNATINMLDYNTTPGMPKIVVLGGGTSHSIFFNEVNAAAGNANAMQAAIDSALATGVKESVSLISNSSLYPNPSSSEAHLNLTLAAQRDVQISIVNELGQTVSSVFSGTMQPGENTVRLDVAELANGLYFVEVRIAEETRSLKLEVNH
jgi:hypothetical protein